MMVMEAQPAVICFDKKSNKKKKQDGDRELDQKPCRFSNFKWTYTDRDKHIYVQQNHTFSFAIC